MVHLTKIQIGNATSIFFIIINATKRNIFTLLTNVVTISLNS